MARKTTVRYSVGPGAPNPAAHVLVANVVPVGRKVTLFNPAALEVYVGDSAYLLSTGSCIRLRPGDRLELETDGDLYARSVGYAQASIEVTQ